MLLSVRSGCGRSGERLGSSAAGRPAPPARPRGPEASRAQWLALVPYRFPIRHLPDPQLLRQDADSPVRGRHRPPLSDAAGRLHLLQGTTLLGPRNVRRVTSGRDGVTQGEGSQVLLGLQFPHLCGCGCRAPKSPPNQSLHSGCCLPCPPPLQLPRHGVPKPTPIFLRLAWVTLELVGADAGPCHWPPGPSCSEPRDQDSAACAHRDQTAAGTTLRDRAVWPFRLQ